MSILSRIGHNLFQVGRYLERTEYLARFSQAHYLHYLDAEYPEHKKELLESLLIMPQMKEPYFETNRELEEDKILNFISIDDANPGSILANVTGARSLAKGTRDYIAADLWEHINCFYHAMNNFSNTRLQRDGFLSLTKKAIQNSLIIKGYLNTMMVQDDGWMLLALGSHLERSIQGTRLLLFKMQEITGKDSSRERDHLIAMLQSIGSYEAYRKLYQQNISRQGVILFMAFHPDFPKSVVHNLYAIQNISKNIGFYGKEEIDIMAQQLNSLLKNFHPQNMGDSEEIKFLQDTLSALLELSGILEQKYLMV